MLLTLVHVLMAGHIAWWWFRGDTLTPVEPSETAFTLEQGLVNAGFVFFASALLLQLVFGRFMCGWTCHIVALQDLCAWLLKKVGVRPHPFRSRLLMWAPFVLAFYMFIWPTLKREVVWPLAERHAPWALEVLGRPFPLPAHGFIPHFITDDFWATFASVGVAIPFVLVCAFLVVYMLGAKAFCTYGCPYGGFFTPLDRFSPGRIIVDHDRCEGCGHCTAVCSSNVRVHEEIDRYGMVVSPGCMKCLDCVSVCPNDALRYGFARPAVLVKKPREAARVKAARVYDLTLGQEVGLTLVFFGTFWSVRGAYELFPILFAMGVAMAVTFVAWKAWVALTRRDARAFGLQMKRSGRLRPAGAAFVAGTALLLALVAHTGVVTWHVTIGNRLYDKAAMDKNLLLSAQPVTPEAEKAEAARAALGHYARAASLGRGGIALLDNLFVERNAALMKLMVGDAEGAEASLRLIAGRLGEQDELAADIARVMARRGLVAERAAFIDDLLTRRPEFWAVRELRAAEWMGTGRAEDVLKDADEALTKIGPTWWDRVARARTHMIAAWALGTLGRPDDALARLSKAAGEAPSHAPARAGLAMGLLQIRQDLAGAAEEMRAAVKHDPASGERRFLLGRMLVDLGKVGEAMGHFEVARKATRDDPRLIDAVFQLLEQGGHTAEAAKWRESAGATAP